MLIIRDKNRVFSGRQPIALGPNLQLSGIFAVPIISNNRQSLYSAACQPARSVPVELAVLSVCLMRHFSMSF